MEPRKSILKNYELVTTNGIPCHLGFGAYGSVQLGKCLKTGMTVAIKKISRKLALNEVEVHGRQVRAGRLGVGADHLLAPELIAPGELRGVVVDRLGHQNLAGVG